MHIAISGTFWSQPNVGSGQYLHGLLNALTQVAPNLRVTLLLPAFLQHTSLPTSYRYKLVSTPFDTHQRQLAKIVFEQIALPVAAHRIRADILHVPYFAPPLITTMPSIVSILDLIPLLLPEYRGRALVRAYTRLVATATPRTSHILAISEATKQDLVRHLHIPPERISVTHLAAGAQYRQIDKEAARKEEAQRYGVSEPFIYYVGGLDARKNVPMLIRAYARMRHAGGPALPLVIAGKSLGSDSQLFPDIDTVIAEQQASEWVRRITVPSADGPLLYAAAELFVFPSRYEGFGLGPLEAMACGTPVITSNRSSLPEVVGDAALLASPDDEVAWASQMRRVLTDQTLRNQLIQRGLAHSAQFQYQKTAKQTAIVYQRVYAYAQ